MGNTTPGLVCGHHHLYSSLARGMPAPPRQPHNFLQILEQVWWRLDAALDLDMIYWAAALGALEALESGTTAIVDHHESPNAIEGSLDAIANACALVGIRVKCAYGITDRWRDDATFEPGGWAQAPSHMTNAARRGLAECERFITAGGDGLVGLHAGFTTSDASIEAATGLAADLGVGVHVHVAEGAVDSQAGRRLEPFATDDWLIVHCVNLDRDLPGTIAHNPRSNMNNGVGYARPARRSNPVVLGTDGIGANMLEEFRLAYVAHRSDDIDAAPDVAWSWLENGWALMPEARNDHVRWNYDHIDSPWHVAFTTGTHALDVTRADGVALLRDGCAVLVDGDEIRAKAAEQSARLFSNL